ncbi:hypothetical protein [Streptomyces fulvoviolaceus]|uniref:hypothetical protein n=1 Tax=Streptomyces fulvoviolaceus TaxID=285535 RepID=UPI0021C1552B|nr:hypothetical protein [Streptomyces fulvoviolaceus]MCT9082862.1 hypothetical protein [Streptomyces fulvoviolaceus]
MSVTVAGAVLAGLLSTGAVVTSPSAAAASGETTPLVPSQSLGTVPAQQAEEAGKALPEPSWPDAAEATVDLSQSAPGEPGTVTPEPSAMASGDATEVADVVEVAPLPDAEGATPQLSRTQSAAEGTATPTPAPSTSDGTEATASASPEPSSTASPQPS